MSIESGIMAEQSCSSTIPLIQLGVKKRNPSIFFNRKNEKIKVASSQYGYFYGDKQLHFPYSLLSVIAYSNQFSDIRDSFQFEKIFIVRDFINDDIKKCSDSDILLCSCYCWNWEATNYLAKNVKKNNPECLIIYGGPEVPFTHNGSFFEEYPYVDILVHNEGEIILHNIFKAIINNEPLDEILGTENKFVKNLPQERIQDLDIIPSPYTDDFIWGLVDKNAGYKYMASWETNRGCPFSCFEENTKIITSRTPNKKAKDIKVGDYLMAFDEVSKQIVETKVEHVFNSIQNSTLKVSFDDESFVEVTPEHPFYVGGKWIEAKDLKVDDGIYHISNSAKNIVNIEHCNEEKNVVNFSCSPYDNYFANYVLSHNCTFCDWGSATKTKIRNFSVEKLFKEIDWFGKNEIGYVEVCDGNFGIYIDRDYSLADRFATIKEQTGFPDSISLTWVKTSSEKIIPIARRLNDANLLRGISLAVQSFDPVTLKNIKRANIKFTSFEELVKRFDKEGLSCYTELIMGLPGETVESFKKNWATLAAIYPLPAVLTWVCSVFNNAPMNDEDYKKQFGIEIFTSPTFMPHTAAKDDPIPEFAKMVRRTNSLPNDDIIELYMYNWLMLTFHAFGLLDCVARYCNSLGIGYTAFYDSLIEYIENSNDSMLNVESCKIREFSKKAFDGKGWDHYDADLGDINWIVGEASWLRIVRNKSKLKNELYGFLLHISSKYSLDMTVLGDLLKFQLLLVSFPCDYDGMGESFDHDWVDFFNSNCTTLSKKDVSYSKKRPVQTTDLIQWGYETLWYGKRTQKYKTSLSKLIVAQNNNGGVEMNLGSSKVVNEYPPGWQ